VPPKRREGTKVEIKYKPMKYEVLLKISAYETVTVEAKTEEEAQARAIRARPKTDHTTLVDVIAVRPA
jgi:hypothetical protein